MVPWLIDAFFWLVLPIAVLEGLRIGRLEVQRRSLPTACALGGVEVAILAGCAATNSLVMFVFLAGVRVLVVRLREGQWWFRGALKSSLIVLAALVIVTVGQTSALNALGDVSLELPYAVAVLVLLCGACFVAILPVPMSHESKETLAAPLSFIAFARMALPVGAEVADLAVVVPVLAAAMGVVCALWLLSAGVRANHFEPSALVSELLVCERGVILSFVWLGLSSGERLAGVGALLEWWSGALALLALEASLRQRPISKPMAFFALGMAVCLPGTVGFVAEDLLAHGLLEHRPVLAALFVAVAAINAVALYRALVNIIVELRAQTSEGQGLDGERRLSLMMLSAAALSLVIGWYPRPFVSAATAAHEAVTAGDNTHHAGV